MDSRSANMHCPLDGCPCPERIQGDELVFHLFFVHNLHKGYPDECSACLALLHEYALRINSSPNGNPGSCIRATVQPPQSGWELTDYSPLSSSTVPLYMKLNPRPSGV